MGFVLAVELRRRGTPRPRREFAGARSDDLFGAIGMAVEEEMDSVPASASAEDQAQEGDTIEASAAVSGEEPSGQVADGAVEEILPLRNDAFAPGLEEFHEGVLRYEGQVEEFDRTLRAQDLEVEVLEPQLQRLRTASAEHLESSQLAFRGLQSAAEDRPSLESAYLGIENALERQVHAVGALESLAAAIADPGGGKPGKEELISHTAGLFQANDALRDTLDSAKVQLLRGEAALPPVEVSECRDELTGLANHLGLAGHLMSLWQGDPHRVRNLSIAMIDLDRFTGVNERYGRAAADRLLQAVARSVMAAIGPPMVAGRMAGARFLVLMPDLDLHVASTTVEEIRQKLALTSFDNEGQELHLTVSCGLAAAIPQDAAQTLFGRAEEALLDAKHQGRNRSCVHDGRQVHAVVSAQSGSAGR
jgi:diguanylate cyclase (GGDEF)-like protein